MTADESKRNAAVARMAQKMYEYRAFYGQKPSWFEAMPGDRTTFTDMASIAYDVAAEHLSQVTVLSSDA